MSDQDTRSREELEAAAGELNVEFTAETTDDELREAVVAAEAAKEDGGDAGGDGE